MHVNLLYFIFCLLRGVGLGAEKCNVRNRSGRALRILLRLTQSYVPLHDAEERENGILIPRTNTLFASRCRRADGFSWVGPIRLGEQREGRSQREMLRAGRLS